jgi:hypothetical protein
MRGLNLPPLLPPAARGLFLKKLPPGPLQKLFINRIIMPAGFTITWFSGII